MGPRRALATLLIVVLGCTGCFTYVPVQPSAVPPDEDVQVRISDEAALRLAREVGVYTSRLEGQLQPYGADSMAIAVPIGRSYQGAALDQVRQTMVVNRSEVLEVRRRQFSRNRTIMASAGAVVGFALAAAAIEQIGDPNIPPDDEQPLPPTPFRLLFSFPFTWSR